ncbi:hypothetical protein BDK51DRAFT_42085 [Blyttiomyces helicus]|uniref:Uncharacterized protein n=1 Tax=Blyttiomyces helicus TaxID=388810 RepID=A0A4P9WLR1_9FUNG|nr:hypothetical protein BDK51DRAFT_42085 [Blyttiomyces helicus]|eukprot:RKO93125.1 hypothetical protein BDK51DRAFT_42085 [Blyttiomyces helicus]
MFTVEFVNIEKVLELLFEIAPDDEDVLSVELDTVNVPPTFTAPDIPTPPATVAAPVVDDVLAVVFATDRVPVIDKDANDVEPDTDNVPPMKVAPIIPTPPLKVAEPVVVDEDAMVFVIDNIPLLLIPPPTFRTEEIPTPPKNVAHPVVIELDTVILVTERIPVVEIEFKTDSAPPKFIEPLTPIPPVKTGDPVVEPLTKVEPPIPRPPETITAPVMLEVEAVVFTTVNTPVAVIVDIVVVPFIDRAPFTNMEPPTPTPPAVTTDPFIYEVEMVVVDILAILEIPTPPAKTAEPVVKEEDAVVLVTFTIPEHDTADNVVELDTESEPATFVPPPIPTPPETTNAPVVDEVDTVVEVNATAPYNVAVPFTDIELLRNIAPPTPTPPDTTTAPVV